MNGPGPTQPPVTTTWSMYRAIVGIGALCALLIVTVFQATAARIRDNRARALASAVGAVLPQARDLVPVVIDAQGTLRPASGDASALPAFLGFAADGRLAGAALAAVGMGYQDNIRVLYAYSFDERAITGFRVLESKETPGLGDKIEKDARFLANFTALDVALDAEGRTLRHAIEAVAEGAKTEPWQVDGITGATISSVAVANILNDSATRWVPALERDARDIARPTAERDE